MEGKEGSRKATAGDGFPRMTSVSDPMHGIGIGIGIPAVNIP